MKRRALLTKCLPAGAALLASGGLASQTGCGPAGAGNQKITVMNPAITEALAERVPLSPRLGTLDGKTIHLVDTNYEGLGRTPVMEELQVWFTRNMPQVKTVFKLKSGNYAADDPALWKEIAENKSDGVIIGIAG
jgi:hypothetical protein